MPTSTFSADPLFKALANAPAQAAEFCWSILIATLKAHPLEILGLLLLIFAIAMAKATAGRWGSLGSVIYNFLYFGILFIIGLIWGPDIFVADWFNAACTVLLYPICYKLTGYILEKIGVLG